MPKYSIECYTPNFTSIWNYAGKIRNIDGIIHNEDGTISTPNLVDNLAIKSGIPFYINE